MTTPNSQPSSNSSSSTLFKPNDPDIGWRYNSIRDRSNKKKVTCDFCKKETSGGISRAKQHQMGIRGNVASCSLTPEDVKLALKEHEENRLAVKQSMAGRELEDDEVVELQDISRLQRGKRPAEEATLSTGKKIMKGPLDAVFYKKSEKTIGKEKQTSMKAAYSKEAREMACQHVARFFYRHGIAFNVAKSQAFKNMVNAIGHFGPNLKPPGYHELRVPMLKKELEYTNELLKSNKDEQAQYGCSIMSDGWRILKKAMKNAKEFIKKGFKDNESRYKEILAIVDKRWEDQLHHPLHSAGHYLNPAHFYSDPTIENDSLLLNGLYDCIEKLSMSNEVVDAIHRELTKYKRAAGLFGRESAKRQRNNTSPVEWWKRYGSETPNLQLFAIKILGLTCSSSGCERNWSTFDHIHSKKRNRLEHQMLQDLVFIKYNQTLKERHGCEENIDSIELDDIDPSSEWLVGDEICEGDPDLVYEDDDLSWLDVERASGVAEPVFNTRSQVASQKAAARTSTPMPPPPPPPSTLPRVFEDLEDDLHDDDDNDDDDDNNDDVPRRGGSDDEDVNFYDV